MEKQTEPKKRDVILPSTSEVDSAKTSGTIEEMLKKSNEKRSKLFTKTTNYIVMKDRKALTAMMNLLAKHKSRNMLPKDIDHSVRFLLDLLLYYSIIYNFFFFFNNIKA